MTPENLICLICLISGILIGTASVTLILTLASIRRRRRRRRITARTTILFRP